MLTQVSPPQPISFLQRPPRVASFDEDSVPEARFA
jgi:hypothetical protein